MSTASTRSVNRGLDPTCGVWPHRPEIKIKQTNSPTPKILKGIASLKRGVDVSVS